MLMSDAKVSHIHLSLDTVVTTLMILHGCLSSDLVVAKIKIQTQNYGVTVGVRNIPGPLEFRRISSSSLGLFSSSIRLRTRTGVSEYVFRRNRGDPRIFFDLIQIRDDEDGERGERRCELYR